MTLKPAEAQVPESSPPIVINPEAGDFRCTCRKLLFQIEGDSVIIKCHHCKRFVRIWSKGIVNIEYVTPNAKVIRLNSIYCD